MGGFIELYKIDKARIKENLYPKISDTSLPDVFIGGIDQSFGTFQSFLNNQYSISKVSYENLLTNLQKEDYMLENDEFTALFDWFTWYYQDFHARDEEIFAHHGFISIGHLTTRYEVPLLFSLADIGIREFHIPLLDTVPNWMDSPILSSDELLLMVDYLILLSFKAACFKESPDIEGMMNSLDISRFDTCTHLHISTEKHLNSYLKSTNHLYRDEMEHLLDGGYEYIPDVMMHIKENLNGFAGPIYLNHGY